MGSTIFKQHSPYAEHWYPLLKPWVNYIPVSLSVIIMNSGLWNAFSKNPETTSQVSETLEDLVEKARWVQQHPDEATKIAEEGKRLAETHLTLVQMAGVGPGAPHLHVTKFVRSKQPSTMQLQEAVQCYVVYLMEQFGKLQAFAPRKFMTDVTEMKDSVRYRRGSAK